MIGYHARGLRPRAGPSRDGAQTYGPWQAYAHVECLCQIVNSRVISKGKEPPVDKDLMAALEQRAVLCDGGMGTQLMASGLPRNVASESWNLDQPQLVEQIHRAYREAGCEMITTNTFGGSTASLARHGLEDKADAINEAGARLAKQGGDGAWVLGDIGPFGGFLEPLGDSKPEEIQAMFRQQAAALQRGGADAVIVETMADPHESSLAVAAALELGNWPVIATFAFSKSAGGGFHTMMGADVNAALGAVIDAGANIVGANCGTALEVEDYRKLAEQLMPAAGNVPVIVQPNAGAPKVTGQDTVYSATPEEMAALARDLVNMGVRVVGGCCGTTPEHLASMAAEVKQ